VLRRCDSKKGSPHQFWRRIMARGQSSVTQMVVGSHGPRCSGGTLASSMMPAARLSAAQCPAAGTAHYAGAAVPRSHRPRRSVLQPFSLVAALRGLTCFLLMPLRPLMQRRALQRVLQGMLTGDVDPAVPRCRSVRRA